MSSSILQVCWGVNAFSLFLSKDSYLQSRQKVHGLSVRSPATSRPLSQATPSPSFCSRRPSQLTSLPPTSSLENQTRSTNEQGGIFNEISEAEATRHRNHQTLAPPAWRRNGREIHRDAVRTVPAPSRTNTRTRCDTSTQRYKVQPLDSRPSNFLSSDAPAFACPSL